ncbi:ATP-binding cassette domain-containing protein [Bacillus pacificus]
MQNMNVHIKAGEVVSLIGPNGSGKSTLLRLIARLLKQSEGGYRFRWKKYSYDEKCRCSEAISDVTTNA